MIVKIEQVVNRYHELLSDEDLLEMVLEYAEVTATLVSERVRMTFELILYPEDIVLINDCAPDYEESVRVVMKRTLTELEGKGEHG